MRLPWPDRERLYEWAQNLIQMIGDVKDEDDMASDSAVHLVTQQSAKAYSDSLIRPADERIKGWIQFNGTGTIAIQDSFNVSSIADNGVGDYTIYWDIDFTDAKYAPIGICSYHTIRIYTMGTAYTRVHTLWETAGTLAVGDPTIVCVLAIGDQ